MKEKWEAVYRTLASCNKGGGSSLILNLVLRMSLPSTIHTSSENSLRKKQKKNNHHQASWKKTILFKKTQSNKRSINPRSFESTKWLCFRNIKGCALKTFRTLSIWRSPRIMNRLVFRIFRNLFGSFLHKSVWCHPRRSKAVTSNRRWPGYDSRYRS